MSDPCCDLHEGDPVLWMPAHGRPRKHPLGATVRAVGAVYVQIRVPPRRPCSLERIVWVRPGELRSPGACPEMPLAERLGALEGRLQIEGEEVAGRIHSLEAAVEKLTRELIILGGDLAAAQWPADPPPAGRVAGEGRG